jgi:sulfite reductase beta subunit-like hemoprotein
MFRFKYVVYDKGIDWVREEIENTATSRFNLPITMLQLYLCRLTRLSCRQIPSLLSLCP